MTSFGIGATFCLLLISAGFLIVPAGIWLKRRFCRKSSWESGSGVGVSHLLIFSGCLLGSVWFLRMAVGIFSIYYPDKSTIAAGDGLVGLNIFEEVFNSLVHALQTFSMDEDYTDYIITGKTMVKTLFGAGTLGQNIYGGYAAVMNFVAPVAGGAVIFDILASISPRIRLIIYCVTPWKEKCYFSELNEASLTLAKSMAATYRTLLKRPAFIFTDAYVDEGNERSSERLLEAKKMGAICLKDDLSHVLKFQRGRKQFFLIDEDEGGNLQTLTRLAESYCSKYIKNAEIYLFVNDDAYIQVEKNVWTKLKRDWDMKDDDELPLTIIPIRGYRNMISNLLVDIPLYEPLMGKKRSREAPCSLTVTILGMGHIGIEMFLATYWFGQILDCSLKIHLLSQESEEEFWDKIDYINPEIRHTTIEGDDILRVYDREDDCEGSAEQKSEVSRTHRKDEMAPVYCQVDYRQCDVRSTQFIQALQPGEDSILDTDYYLVSLGTDEENISVAGTVRKYVGEQQVRELHRLIKAEEDAKKEAGKAQEKAKTAQEAAEAAQKEAAGTQEALQKKQASQKAAEETRKAEEKEKNARKNLQEAENGMRRTVIAYVVYDTELSEILNREKKYSCCRGSQIYVCAMGALKEVYSERNVFLREYELSTQFIHANYLSAGEQEKRAKDHADRMKDDYKYWASQARVMHRKYKLFSMGLLTESSLDFEETRGRTYEDVVKEAVKAFHAMGPEKPGCMSAEQREMMHRIAWLEHRRWNAFTRTMGYRGTDAYDAYMEMSKSHRQKDLRLHPCLRECDQNGIHAAYNEDGTLNEDSAIRQENRESFDRLEKLAYKLHEIDPEIHNFKVFDYPDSDF